MTSEEHRPADSERRLWCLGLPLAGERPLSDDERRQVRQLKRRAGSALALGVGLLLLCLVPLMLAAVALDDELGQRGAWGRVLVTALALLGVALPVVLLLWLRGVIARFRRLRQDLRAGRLLIFAGASPASATETSRAEDGPKPEGPQRVEVLERSQVLLRLDGQAEPGNGIAEIYEVTAAPESTPRFAVPKAWRDELGPELSVERRRLSAAELAELAGQVRRLKRPSASLLFLLGLALLGLLAAVWTGTDLSQMARQETIYLALMTAGLLLNGWVYWRDLRLARRLELDFGNEWVMIFEEEEAAPRATVEVLPASAAVWTEDGHPSRWRQRERSFLPGGSKRR